jgi:acyl carrier protein
MMTDAADSRLIEEVAGVVRRAARIPQGIQVHDNTLLLDDLGIDSLDLLAVILQLQDHFEVVIEPDAVPNLCRVADLAAYLADRIESVRS